MITSEAELPDNGTVITLANGAIPLSEPQQENMVVIQIGDTKKCWLLATESHFKSLHFMQLSARLTKMGFEVDKKEKCDYGVLKILYDKERQKTKAGVSPEESKIIRYFEQVVGDAMRDEVSDIHIEKRNNKAVIKMRKHGEMIDYKEMTPLFATEMASVVYNVLAENKDILFSDQEYQQAAINRVIDGNEVKLRYQSLPVYPEGFDIVLRVLPIGKNEDFVPLEKLGYAPSQVSALMDAVSRPVGGLVIAGTTGSGKSTTLKNLIMYINSEHGFKDKIYTVEDPPEYKIPRVSQIPVIRRKGDDYTKKSPFEAPIAACMRADPDIIMIGEVRDRISGDLLKKAIQSGHQVLTTVHAASGLAIIERFVDFDIGRSVLGSQEFISGLCYQKLIPIMCQNCAVEMSEAITSGNRESDILLFDRLMQVCDLTRDVIKIRGNGCDKCFGVGVTGRTVCAEIILPDLTMLELFREAKALEAYRHWRGLSDKDPYSLNMIGKTAMEHAVYKMRKGLISPHDVESSFGLITTVNIA